MTVTRRHRLRKLNAPRSRLLLVVVAAVGVLFLAGSVLVAQLGRDEAQTQTGVVEQQRDATAAQAASLASQIQTECDAGALAGPICQQAEQVAAEPIPGPIGPTGPPGSPPTPEEIRAAVDAYLLEHPPPAGRAPTAAEVAAAVASYLTANPPTPGRPPTAGEIAAAVEIYFDNNPPRAGRDGEAGRAPTAAEIRAAVDAYMAENPPPAGPTGATGDRGDRGAQGVGVQSVRAEQRDDMCVLVFILVDPADGSTEERAVPVANGVCEDAGPLGP